MNETTSCSSSFFPPSRTIMTLLLFGNVVLICFFVSIFILFPILFIFCFLVFKVLGGSVIACRSIQRQIVAVELDIYIFKSFLLPMHELEHEYTSHQVPHNGGPFLFFLLERWRSGILIYCVLKFDIGFQLVYLQFYLLGSQFFACAHVFILCPICLEFQRKAQSRFGTVSSFHTCLQPL